MAKSQITIRVDEDVLRNFKAHCLLRGITPTEAYGDVMAKQVEVWQEESRRLSQKLGLDNLSVDK